MSNSVHDDLEVRVALETLRALEVAGMLISPTGSILGVAPDLEAFPEITVQSGTMLQWTCHVTDALFRSALQAMELQNLKMRVIRPPAEATCSSTIILRRLAGLNINAILLTISQAVLRIPDAATLQTLFGLTKAEARVLGEIGKGSSPREIAKAHNLSQETVRTQLKSVMKKTGASRQADLVTLIAAYQSG